MSHLFAFLDRESGGFSTWQQVVEIEDSREAVFERGQVAINGGNWLLFL